MTLAYDFYYFYAAATLAREGHSIYDRELLQQQMWQIGWPQSEFAYGFPYPPWSLWIYYWTAFLPFDQAKIAWLTLSALLTVACSAWFATSGITALKIGKKIDTRMLIFSLLTFFPVFKSWHYGQFSFALLASLLMFLKLLSSRKNFAAGIALSICLIKPHLILPFILTQCAWSWRQRSIQLSSGLGMGFIVQLIIGEWIHPNLLSEFFSYLADFSSSLANLEQPVLFTLLGGLFGVKHLAMFVFVVACLLAVMLGLFGSSRLNDNKQNIMLWLPTSLIVAPYGWTHDWLMLVIPYLNIVGQYEKKQRSLTILTISGVLLISLCCFHFLGEQWMFWLPLLILGFGLKTRKARLS